jgi:hypothetical protein
MLQVRAFNGLFIRSVPGEAEGVEAVSAPEGDRMIVHKSAA